MRRILMVVAVLLLGACECPDAMPLPGEPDYYVRFKQWCDCQPFGGNTYCYIDAQDPMKSSCDCIHP